MPCRNDYDDHVSVGEVERQVHAVRAELEPLLCEACALLEDKGLLQKVSTKLNQWYHAHSEREKDRVAYEAAKKLTVKERKALGLDLDALAKKAQR